MRMSSKFGWVAQCWVCNSINCSSTHVTLSSEESEKRRSTSIIAFKVVFRDIEESKDSLRFVALASTSLWDWKRRVNSTLFASKDVVRNVIRYLALVNSSITWSHSPEEILCSTFESLSNFFWSKLRINCHIDEVLHCINWNLIEIRQLGALCMHRRFGIFD